VDAALPWLYLRGISTGQMQEALEVLVGPQAKGLSASVVSRLKGEWLRDYKAWKTQPLGEERWLYWWADGIYSGLRAERQRLCLLVIIGLDAQGKKHFVALEDGVRESTQSWREVLLDLKERGVQEGPLLAIGDGSLGFWGALEEVYPKARHQRCWVHKTTNVLNALPKSVQPKAKDGLHQIWMAPSRAAAEAAADHFASTYGAKYPKAVHCLTKDREALLTFYDFPAEHWVHIRTTNPIESTFGTIRHRTDQARGCVTRTTMLAFAYKLAEAAERRWKRIRGLPQIGKLLEGVHFHDGLALQPSAEIAA